MDKKMPNIKRTYSEEVEVEDVSEKVAPLTKTGVVVNCDALRVRNDHEKDTDVIATLLKGTKVTIDGDSINGFYHVVTEDGVVGWCMTAFLELL